MPPPHFTFGLSAYVEWIPIGQCIHGGVAYKYTCKGLSTQIGLQPKVGSYVLAKVFSS